MEKAQLDSVRDRSGEQLTDEDLVQNVRFRFDIRSVLLIEIHCI